MKRYLPPAVVLSLALLLSGCAGTTLGNLLGEDDPATAQDALKAADVALTTYRDVYQTGLIAYLNLPYCPQPRFVACRDQTVVPKLLAVDKAATSAIVAAQKVLEGSVVDTGQIETAIAAVDTAEQTIAAAGVALKQ